MLAPVAAGPGGGEVDTPMSAAAQEMHGGARRTYVSDDEPGRNDPCPCGSGRKYKKCCGR
jgi:uncharacterized protein YecA (UPF0149 family)